MMDPEWFYSAIAQCSAAIVGIMGAFLISKSIHKKQTKIHLSSEIEGLKKDQKSLKDEETEKISNASNENWKDMISGYYNPTALWGIKHSATENYLEQSINKRKDELEVLEKDKSLSNILLMLFGFSLLGVFFPLAMLLTSSQVMIDFRFITFGIILTGFILMMLFLSLEILEYKFITKIIRFLKKLFRKKK